MSSNRAPQAHLGNAVVLPTHILLGLAKAGTTKLHACLTAPRVFQPRPCCTSKKELNIFSERDPVRALHGMRIPGWPADNSSQHQAWDCTPSSLSDVRALRGILKAYAGQLDRLHLVTLAC